MNPKQPSHFIHSKNLQHGMSLIELMIAITLGLFLIWGVTQSFLTSKQTYRTQQGLARIQENGRMAQEFIGFDVRNAGDYGCGSGDVSIHGSADMRNDLPAQTPALTACNTSPFGTPGINMITAITSLDDEYEYAVYGFDNVAASTTVFNTALAPAGGTVSMTLSQAPKAGTDVLMVHVSEDLGVLANAVPNPYVDPATMGSASSLTLNTTLNGTSPNHAPLVANDRISVSDCATMKIFVVDATSTSTVTANASNFCTKAVFQQNATVHKLKTVYYFVSDNGRSGYSLYQQVGSGTTAQELMEGVEDMQLQFGIDNANSGDGVVDLYKSANDLTGAAPTTTAAWTSAWNAWDWWKPTPVTTVCDKTTTATFLTTCQHRDLSAVRSVRYSLLLRSADDGVLSDKQTISFNGNTLYGGAALAANGDRRLREVFTSTVGIRSRQLAP